MEKLETINQFLRDTFGIDTDDSEPIFRVVWSEDQREKRLMSHSDAGIELLHPEVREVMKYRSMGVRDSYILERRVLVPDESLKELAGLKKSYEPLWVFRSENGQPLRPTISGCQFVIDALYAALGKKTLAKYKDPLAGLTAEESAELKSKKVDQIMVELYGDEADLAGETHNESGSAVFVPKTYGDTIN